MEWLLNQNQDPRNNGWIKIEKQLINLIAISIWLFVFVLQKMTAVIQKEGTKMTTQFDWTAQDGR